MRRLPLATCVLFVACSTAPSPPRVRPAQWAEPVIGAEVANWYRVSPDLHRCAQPSQKGMQELAHFGMQSIVNLRELIGGLDADRLRADAGIAPR